MLVGLDRLKTNKQLFLILWPLKSRKLADQISPMGKGFQEPRHKGLGGVKGTDSKLFEKKLNSKKPHAVLRTPTRSRFLEKVSPNAITLQSLISKHNLPSGPAK